jgi:uncharacterized protein YgbK (DUF1537 family)
LRLHLGKQTKRRIALFDILKVALPVERARATLRGILADKPDIVLFDLLYASQLPLLGELIDGQATAGRPLFSVGSSGIEMALGAYWTKSGKLPGKKLPRATAAKQVLVGSGSCSPVTSEQIAWASRNGFAEVLLDVGALATVKSSAVEIKWATAAAAELLGSGLSVIVHTTKSGPDNRIAAKLKGESARVLGSALGKVLLGAVQQSGVRRVCVAGGDTSSYAARAMGIEALEMIARLTPGAPLCRAYAAGSSLDRCEVVFKGGQVGAENYFGIVRGGKT